jgi:hypothetical protein
MSLRLPDDLREWVVAYAGERGVSQAVVISAAVREFRALAARGVPALEEPPARSAQGVPWPAAPRAPVKRKAVIAPFGHGPTEAERERTAALVARQEKLNRAKYGRS